MVLACLLPPTFAALALPEIRLTLRWGLNENSQRADKSRREIAGRESRRGQPPLPPAGELRGGGGSGRNMMGSWGR